uniref:F-box/LRR-repeat protein At3g48880-like n=1 Tax=Fragaria vesca subsp. vesca TaxID=101020 RepID=UPI0005C9E7C2|nr:PREDICTED: F-box/LRR-repeat protein At3g48880-like [Fragaria vesca subsp. vesca]XP_011462795.1 PREDICTED: F-box/LRR-repeat protein At3g48880-like [Fragaria vesca subsp. vesca]
MAQRRWEELDSDCLTNVFGRVGMESLLVDIPFVCKSWHKASHDPSCWLSIDFPNVDYYLSVPVLLIRFEHNYKTKEWPAWSRVFLNGLVKIVIERSKGKATCLKLPGWCSKEALKLVAPEWPHLKSVGLHDDLVRLHYGKIPDMIRNWRNLEELPLGATDKNLEQILEQVSLHCKKLYSLCLSNTQTSSIHGDTARSIVSFLPNIKHLTLRNCGVLRPEDLVTIIRGCKDLVYLDVTNSSTLLVGDEQLAKLASHIGILCCLIDRMLHS